MRIPKLLLTFCAASVCAGFISLRADDNDTPEQSAAREALRQKMREAEAQGKGGVYFVPLTNATSSGVIQVPVSPEQKPPAWNASPAVIPPTAQSPSTQTWPTDNPAQAAARAALEQQMRVLDAQQTALSADNPAQAAARAALEKKMYELDNPPDNPAQAAARAALEKKVAELAQQTAAPTKPLAAKPAPAVANAPGVAYPGKELGLKPIVAPPLPISAAKEAQLDALLTKYKTDQVTPDEYQKQRAEILAAP